MSGTFIATTPKASVHALAYQGIMVYSSFPQIRNMVMRKFGDEYVLIFAEPVENRQSGEIDWYTPVYGKARRLEELPEEEREASRDKIVKIAQAVKEFAEELIHSPDPLKVTRGHILRLAVLYPDESYIYVVGEQPVLTCWGFGPGTPGVEPKDLTRLALPKPAAAPIAAAASGNGQKEGAVAATVIARRPIGWGWLWWLLPLLAACLLLLFLFTGSGGREPLAGVKLFDGPALPFMADLPDRSQEIAGLEHEIGELRLRLDQHVALCVPERSPESRKTVTPEPVQEALVIPEKSEDTSFLEGLWRCDTGLANLRTREPVEVQFAFRADGSGYATTFEKNDKCTGAATAELRDGELRIDVAEQHCEKSGDSYSRMSIICKNAAGSSTQCTGSSPGGNTWNADFRRIR